MQEDCGVAKIKAERRLKIWMQALVLTAVFLFYPVSALWTWEEIEELEETASGGEAVQPGEDVPEEEKPRIALTFDDGPSTKYTPVLLDGLKERDVRATFFVIGANIEKDDNAALIRRMKAEGHVIGNHTYHHVDLSKMDVLQAQEEIMMTDQLIEEITGEEPFLVRPPFGAFPKEAEEEGKLYVKWTVDSEDWVLQNTEAAVRKVVTDTKENDIILMHDCYGTSVEAALQIVNILQERGYEFVTVDELLIELLREKEEVNDFMIDEFSRTELLIGEEKLKRLKSAFVMVFGVGGVGSHCIEALARSGVGKLALIDNDTVSVTNINRQSIA